METNDLVTFHPIKYSHLQIKIAGGELMSVIKIKGFLIFKV